MNELIQRAEFFWIKIIPERKIHVQFKFDEIKISEQGIGKNESGIVLVIFKTILITKMELFVLDNKNLVELYNEEKLIKEKSCRQKRWYGNPIKISREIGMQFMSLR